MNETIQKEVAGNRLFVRDEQTNAFVPVLQPYKKDLQGKQSHANFLYIRDVDTNALVPVFVMLSPLDMQDIDGLLEALNSKADLVGGLIPAHQLPSYVDDVIEGELVSDTEFDVEGFIIVPERGKIYVDITTNLSYRWSGSIYIEISKSQTRETLGLDKVDNTPDSEKPVSTPQQQAIENAIGSVQVGGVNLLRNSDFQNMQGWYSETVTSSNRDTLSPLSPICKVLQWAGVGWWQKFRSLGTSTTYRFEKGVTYTMSVYAKADSVVVLSFGVEGISQKQFSLSTDWKRYENTFVGNGTSTTITIYSSGSVNKYITMPQIEIGNKATDWKPSNEDIQDKLTALSSRLTALENK